MNYVIVCGPVGPLPVLANGYHLSQSIDALRNRPCIDRNTVVNVTLIAQVEGITKPYCDQGICNGAIYQV
jgi:hypothetical protein